MSEFTRYPGMTEMTNYPQASTRVGTRAVGTQARVGAQRKAWEEENRRWQQQIEADAQRRQSVAFPTKKVTKAPTQITSNQQALSNLIGQATGAQGTGGSSSSSTRISLAGGDAGGIAGLAGLGGGGMPSAPNPQLKQQLMGYGLPEDVANMLSYLPPAHATFAAQEYREREAARRRAEEANQRVFDLYGGRIGADEPGFAELRESIMGSLAEPSSLPEQLRTQMVEGERVARGRADQEALRRLSTQYAMAGMGAPGALAGAEGRLREATTGATLEARRAVDLAAAQREGEETRMAQQMAAAYLSGDRARIDELTRQLGGYVWSQEFTPGDYSNIMAELPLQWPAQGLGGAGGIGQLGSPAISPFSRGRTTRTSLPASQGGAGLNLLARQIAALKTQGMGPQSYPMTPGQPAPAQNVPNFLPTAPGIGPGGIPLAPGTPPPTGQATDWIPEGYRWSGMAGWTDLEGNKVPAPPGVTVPQIFQRML